MPARTLTGYVFEHARWWPDKPAVIDGPSGATLRYHELVTAVRRIATGLVTHGVSKGDVVALCSPNGPEFIIAYYAALAAGATITPVNPMVIGSELARQLRHSGARWMVTTEEILQQKSSQAAAAGIRRVVVFGTFPGAIPFAQLSNHQRARSSPPSDGDTEDLALLPYSSGTSGRPKAVLLSHGNLISSLCQTRLVQLVRPDDVLLAALPLCHIYGMQTVMNLGLHEGATLVTMPRFDLRSALSLVQQYRVTRADVVPPIVLALARHPAVNECDLSSLRVITCSAAPLGAELARSCAQRLGCRVKQSYGMTELAGATHCAPDRGRDEPGLIGPPLPGVRCRVVDCATGDHLGVHQPGELLIQTPAAMRGYLNDPSATAETIDEQGWVHTGDIASRDAEDWFRVVDRRKDLIKYKGYQVSPAELEEVLLSHPAVADAAVVASPDELAGEVPKAFVVLRSAAGAEELLQYVAQRVSPYQEIRRVEFTEEIPKSPTGKILRRVLIERDRAALEPAW
jgi:acyl-CoA synthetase (AMP-forming)/AMP-acid ligase II